MITDLLAGMGIITLSVLIIWDAVWKGIGMWHSARNKQTAWFVAILIFNTVGILPIIYLLFFRRNR